MPGNSWFPATRRKSLRINSGLDCVHWHEVEEIANQPMNTRLKNARQVCCQTAMNIEIFARWHGDFLDEQIECGPNH